MKAILILLSLYFCACVRTTPIADAPHSPGIVSPDTVWIRTVDTVYVKGPVRIVYRDVEKVDAWGWLQPINIDNGIPKVLYISDWGIIDSLIIPYGKFDSIFSATKGLFSDSLKIDSIR